MAKISLGSSKFNGSNGKHFTLELQYELTQDNSTNKSTIKYYLYVKTSQYGTGYGSRVPGYINGVDVGGVTSLSGNSTVLIGTKTETKEHNPDGTLTVSYSASMGGVWTGLGYANISGDLTLPTIPRATKLNAQTLTINTASTITWTKASSDFKHTLTYEFGSLTGTIGTAKSLVDNVSWTPPNSFYQQMKDAKVKKGKLYLTTYKGDTQIGDTQEAELTINAKESEANVVIEDFSIRDENSTTKTLTGDNSVLVLGRSTAFVTLVFTARKWATINSVVINGKTVSVSAGTTDSNGNTSYGVTTSLGTATTGSFTVTITDSRTFPTTKSTTNDIINYIPLDVVPNFKRIAPTTGQVGLQFDGNYFNSSFGDVSNSLTISYKYKKSSETSYTSVSLTKDTHYKISGNKYYSGTGSAKSVITLAPTFDYKEQYDMQLLVSDKLTSLTINAKVVKGIPIIWWNSNKFVVNGSLHIATAEGAVQTTIINGDIHNNGTFRNEGNATIVGTTNLKGVATLEKRAVLQQGYRVANLTGTHGTAGYILACRLTILGTYQNQAITMRVLQRGREGSLTIRFASNNSTDPALNKFLKTGNINANIVKNSAGVWDLYIQKSEGYDQIDIVELSRGNYTAISVEWINTNASSLPSGFVEATPEDVYSTSEHEIGTWYDGKKIYRKVLNMTLTAQNTRYNHNISNFGSIIKAYGKLHRSDGLQQLIPANYSNWEIWLYDINGTSFTLRFSNNQWNSGLSDCQVVLEYTKTT